MASANARLAHKDVLAVGRIAKTVGKDHHRLARLKLVARLLETSLGAFPQAREVG